MNEFIKMKFLLLNILATNLVMFNYDLNSKENVPIDIKKTSKTVKSSTRTKKIQIFKKTVAQKWDIVSAN